MSSDTPKLSVVGAQPGGTSAGPAVEPSDGGAAAESPPGAGRRRTVWLLGALLAVVSVLLIAQVQRGRELGRRVQALSVELGAARDAIEAQRQHLGAIRSELGAVDAAASALERRIAELGALADRDPLASRPGSPPEPQLEAQPQP